MLTIITSLALVSVGIYFTAAVRVCPTVPTYDLLFSKKCYDNPASEQNITEIIQNWGFTAEEHYITTDDGYILLLERAYTGTSKGTPIIIVHGIAMNALGFIFREKESLVYFLGSRGYDVWILNLRGVGYSRGHANLTTQDKQYWYYSVNELGIYDVRSTIKYVNKETSKKAIYIGFSMGTTCFYVYSTTFPSEAESYLTGMIGLGPAINFKGARTLLQISAPLWPAWRSLIYQLFHGEIITGYTRLLQPIIKTSGGIYFAQTVINLVAGFDYEQIDAISFPFLTRWLDTAAVEVWTHFIQIYYSGVFRNYDHGSTKNIRVYGQRNPPAYNISKISVPIALFVAVNDWVATPTNAEQIYSELRNSSRCGYHTMGLPKWNHYDFILAKDINEYLHEPLYDKIRIMESQKCET